MAGTYTFSNAANTAFNIPVKQNSSQFCCHIELVNDNTDQIVFQGTNDNINYFKIDGFKRNDDEDHVTDFATSSGEYYINVGAINAIRFTVIIKGDNSGDIVITGFFSTSSSNSKGVSSILGKAAYLPQGADVAEKRGSVMPIRMGPDGGLIVTGTEFDEMRKLLDDIKVELKIANFHLGIMSGEEVHDQDIDTRFEV